MTPERWQRVEQIYQEALRQQPATRAEFLAQACADDDELRREIQSLLRQRETTERFVQPPLSETLATSTPGLAPGARLGPYEILAAIGAGGMGEVYRARDSRLDRVVAIKLLRSALTDRPELQQRFEREARAISSLNHPHICTLHDIGQQDGVDYLVMEYLDGETLAHRLAKGRLPMDQVLRYGMEIAGALAAAHSRGIVHRDLKPGNIMVTKTGLKVLDFGLAKFARTEDAPAEQAETLTASQAIVGTPAYMAPEQLEGKECDARTDIFALGLVLYEMATGRRPFTGDSRAALIAEVMRCEPDLSELRPPQAAHVVQRCLAKDAGSRWQSASDVRLELEWAGKVQPAPQRRPTAWLAVAATLILIASIALWLVWRAQRPVDRPMIRLSVDLGPDAIEASPGSAGLSWSVGAIISPDGSRLAFSVRPSGGHTRLAARLLSEPKPTLLPGTEGAQNPFFSPDSQSLGFFADGKMKKTSVHGGSTVALFDAPNARGASWGEDDTIIVAPSSVSGLYRVPAAGGVGQQLTRPAENGEATHRLPQWLPGGEAVLFTGGDGGVLSDRYNIEVLSLKTGQIKTVVRGGYNGHYLPSGHLVYLRQGTLFGVRFDLARLEARSTPAPLLEDMARPGNLAFDENGTLVYVSADPSSRDWPLVWMDSSGKIQPLLAPRGYHGPRLSPDGNRLAIGVLTTNGSEIWVHDLQRATASRLTLTTTDNFSPVWAPDGKHLVFNGRNGGGFSIWWARADGAGEPQRLLESRYYVMPYSISPDGSRVAYFEYAPETAQDIWILPLDLNDPEHPKPRERQAFLRRAEADLYPAFSPDGRWIAYSSNESGTFEVYVRPFPGPGGRWLISGEGGSGQPALFSGCPVWSRDGRALFYLSADNHIMEVAYTVKGDLFVAETARRWSGTPVSATFGGTRSFDVTPDGKRVVALPAPENPAGDKGNFHVTFLLNFFDEVRRRIAAGGK